MKVVSQHNDSHIEKIESYIKGKFDEVAINHLKQKILADLKEQYQPSNTYHLDSSIINLLKDHKKSLESEIQFLRKEIKEKNTFKKTKFTDNVETKSLSHSTKQGDSNKVIATRW